MPPSIAEVILLFGAITELEETKNIRSGLVKFYDRNGRINLDIGIYRGFRLWSVSSSIAIRATRWYKKN